MTSETLPLFAWRPPCRVLVFPLDKRIGKVRHIAESLSRKEGFLAEVYWKQVVTASRRHLLRVGLSEEQANDEIAALFDAVQAEMTRQYFQNTGGAA
jgi:hypothetical protein